jgi:carbon monoxide dehydrogenase subunit G
VAESYSRHALIEAPLDAVWDVISDPRLQPAWWPDVDDVRIEGEPTEGAEYTLVVHELGSLKQVDRSWVVERLDRLREAHFSCTESGSYTRFALTPAQEDTFIEVEIGMLPTNEHWRAREAAARPFFLRWLREVLDALPEVVGRRGSGLDERLQVG